MPFAIRKRRRVSIACANVSFVNIYCFSNQFEVTWSDIAQLFLLETREKSKFSSLEHACFEIVSRLSRCNFFTRKHSLMDSAFKALWCLSVPLAQRSASHLLNCWLIRAVNAHLQETLISSYFSFRDKKRGSRAVFADFKEASYV